jgi:hypothetical protein
MGRCRGLRSACEIVENLHRQDLTPEEAALQRAEYARLSAVERGEIPPEAPIGELRQSHTPGVAHTEGGVAQTARELGVPRTTLQQDIAIASLTPEQRASARLDSICSHRAIQS